MNFLILLLRTCLLLFIGAGAFIDAREQFIPVWLPAAGAAVGIILQAVLGSTPFYMILLGCAAGLLLLGISLVSNRAIGTGDAIMLIVSGIYLGPEMNILLMLFSLIISAAASIVLMIAMKAGRRSRIPFIPFMLGGYICLLPVM